MKLYDSRRAPNPRRVRWVMAEKGITDIELVDLDLIAGDHKRPEHRARAGLAHVPVLELDDGAAIGESLAICRYLEALHPEPNLFGRDPLETAVIEMWTRRCELYLANPLALATRYSHPALAALGGQDPEAGHKARADAERMLRRLDAQLECREFISAHRVTLAVVVVVTCMVFDRLI